MWFKRLWLDESGAINSMDLILTATILILGSVVGLVCLRNQVVQELNDTGQAIGKLNQSYSYSSRSLTSGSFSASVGGASYTDAENLDGTIDVSVEPAIMPNKNPGEDG